MMNEYLGISVKARKVALIGGAGFIGHTLALKLTELGASVTIFDSFAVNNFVNALTDPERQNNPLYKAFLEERFKLLEAAGVELIVSNATDRYEVAKILDEDFDVVYVLAAVAHASRSNFDPEMAIKNGAVPLQNVIFECVNRPELRLVYLSSSTVYGNFTKETVDEDDQCKPFGVYAVLKYCGEQLLKACSEVSDLNYSVVRPSALYGERCISRRVSQVFLENSIAGVPSIFSGVPNEKLDFTYIQDVVQGLIRAGFHEHAAGEVFNITYGNARPILKLIEILRDEFPNVDVQIVPRDQATPLRGTLSNEKAKSLIGFKPSYPLEIGYNRYINWYKDFLNQSHRDLAAVQQTNE